MLSFHRLVSLPYNYKNWNSYLLRPNNKIPPVFLISIWDIILSFQTWEFRASAIKHWNSGTICVHVWILALFHKHWNSHLIHTHFGIMALFFTHWNFPLILSNIKNSGPISIITEILALFLQTLEFLSYPSTGGNEYLASSFQTLEFWLIVYTHWFSDLILQNIGILILSF